MSRRESRLSLNIRQTDALSEFENFKKKFLLQNKHITKLNITLSVKIEELNARISTLSTENLRLRASEIALVSQVKREREKSNKILEEAETAVLGLSKHFAFLRHTFNVRPSSPQSPSPSPPRAARRPPSSQSQQQSPDSPTLARLSRPPNIPGIYEDDEPIHSSSDERAPSPPSPRRKAKTKSHLSASKLPLPARSTPSPPLPRLDFTVPITLASRKPGRRQSGLIVNQMIIKPETLELARPPSPAFGSPIRREAALETEEEDIVAVRQDLVDVEVEAPTLESLPKKEKKKPKKDRELGDPLPQAEAQIRDVERKRRKDLNGELTARKPRLKDVTNSPRRPDTALENTDPLEAPSLAPIRTFLTSSPPSRSSSLPTPQPSSPPQSEAEADAANATGRERRVRKSVVSYAEPKLNTKMRRPDPEPGAAPLPKKRQSAAAALSSKPSSSSSAQSLNEENETEGRSSVEFPLRVNGKDINPAAFPLPASRPSSAVGLAGVTSSPPPARASSAASSHSGVIPRRAKSRAYYVEEDDEDDGVDADGEYVPSPARGGAGVGAGAGAGAWVNVDGRKRGLVGKKRDDERRHTLGA